MKKVIRAFVAALLLVGAAVSTSTAQVSDVYKDPNMDFGSVQTVAVLPFTNLARDQVVAERVRDVFINMLLSTEAVYVLPVGEVGRGIATAEIRNPTAPTSEEVIKLGSLLKVDAVITGVVREYGEVRSGTSASNVISMSIQLIEAQTGKVVWSGSSTKGGVGFMTRLFGGGGQPLNKVTQDAVKTLLDKLVGK